MLHRILPFSFKTLILTLTYSFPDRNKRTFPRKRPRRKPQVHQREHFPTKMISQCKRKVPQPEHLPAYSFLSESATSRNICVKSQRNHNRTAFTPVTESIELPTTTQHTTATEPVEVTAGSMNENKLVQQYSALEPVIVSPQLPQWVTGILLPVSFLSLPFQTCHT